jgi:hypothetical protein
MPRANFVLGLVAGSASHVLSLVLFCATSVSAPPPLPAGSLVLNVDIKEAKDKPPKQARLQAPLRIELAPNDEEQYDDLDEFVAR